MARGDSNILYNPPKITKKKKISDFFFHFGAENKTTFPIQGVSLRDGKIFFLQEKEGGSLSLIQLFKRNNTGMRRREKLIDPVGDSPCFFAKEGFLWKRGESVFLQNSKEERETYEWDLPGEVLHFHASKDYIYALWQDESDQSPDAPQIVLSRAARVLPRSSFGTFTEWEDSFSYPGRGIVRMEERGDDSILLYDEDDIISLTTLGPAGLGRVYSIDPDMAETLRRDLSGSDSELKITPGKEDGQYYYLRETRQRLELRFADLGHRVNKRIALLAEEDYLSGANSDILEQWKEVKLRRSEDGVVVFVPGRRIIHVRDGGLLDEGQVSGDYLEITIDDKKAILWSQTAKEYQELAW